MKWVTRKHIRVNRVATAWLIRKFVDPDAEFIFVEPAQVAEVERAHAAIGFDAPGARYAHDKGVTSFEQIVQERGLRDAALLALTRIVHAADISGALDQAPEAAGLRAISHGFPLVTKDDYETMERAFFIYDALYAYLKGVMSHP